MGPDQFHETRSFSASDLSIKSSSDHCHKRNSCTDMMERTSNLKNAIVKDSVPYQDSGILKRFAPGQSSGYYSRRFHPRQYHSLPHHYKLPILNGQFLKEKVRENDGIQSGYSTKLSLVVDWFKGFNSDQKNKMLMLLFNECEQPQNHLLSTLLQDKLHMSCPPNCQDFLLWLPSVLAYKILSYLDPVSLAKCSQVCKYWDSLSNSQFLWQNLMMQPTWKLSQSGHFQHLRQIKLSSEGGKKLSWKKIFADRYRLHRNWLRGQCHVRTFEGHTQGVSCVQFDETRIVSGSHDKTIKVWNIRTNSPWSVMTLVGHSGTVRCLHLMGNRLVSGSTDQTLKVWDLSVQDEWSSIACKVTMVGHTDTVRCVQMDTEKVVSGSYDNTLKIWSLKSGECSHTLRGHIAHVLCLQFHCNTLVSGSADKTIKVWSLEEFRCNATLYGHQDAVTCISFDEHRIISGSLDNNIKIWNLKSGVCLSTLDWKNSEGHTGVIRCLQANERRMVSASDDRTLKVWQLETNTGQRLLTLRNHTDGVTCLQFNDFIIVSGSYDRTVKLWDFSVC